MALDRAAQTTVVRYLRERIATDQDPRRFGDPLRKELAGLWKSKTSSIRNSVVADGEQTFYGQVQIPLGRTVDERIVKKTLAIILLNRRKQEGMAED